MTIKDKKLFLLPSLFFFFLWSFLIFPSYFWVLLALLIFSLVLGIKLIYQFNLKDFKLFFLPLALGLGGPFFFLLIPNRIFQALFSLLLAVVLFFLLETLEKIKENPVLVFQSTRNLLWAISFLAAFLDVLFLYNLRTFLPLSLIMVFNFLLFLCFNYILFWLENNISALTWLYNFIISFILTQILWIADFWNVFWQKENFQTLNYGIPLSALIVIIFYYCFWGLTFHHFSKDLNKKIVLEYLILSTVIILSLLITTRWQLTGGI